MRWWPFFFILFIPCAFCEAVEIPVRVTILNSPVEILFLDAPGDMVFPGKVVSFGVRDNNTLVDVRSVGASIAGIDLEPRLVASGSVTVAYYEVVLPDVFGIFSLEVSASDEETTAVASSSIFVGEGSSDSPVSPAPPASSPSSPLAPAGSGGGVIVSSSSSSSDVVVSMFSVIIMTILVGSILKSSFLEEFSGAVDVVMVILVILFLAVMLVEYF